MLSKGSAPLEPRRLSRWLLPVAGGLLSLAVLGVGLGLGAPAPRQEAPGDGSKKEEVKKEQPRKEEPKKEEPKKDQPRQRPEVEEPDLQGFPLPFDPEEMFRNLPPGLAEEHVRMMREQAKEMRRALQQMQQGLPLGGMGGGWGGGMAAFPGANRAQQSRLGVRLEKPSPTLADQLDLPEGQGLVVEEVRPDSAAARAGIKTHDILLELNGKPVPSQAEDFRKLLNEVKANTPVPAVVLRKGKKEAIKALSLPEARAERPERPAGPQGFPPAFPGLPALPPAGFGGFGGFGGGFQGFPGGGGGGFAGAGGSDRNGVMTTMFRGKDGFTLRHQEGSLIITLTGKVADGKATVTEIRIQDGAESHKYESADKVPAEYRDKVKGLIETSEKTNARIDVKTP
jgi:hypothetical protein